MNRNQTDTDLLGYLLDAVDGAERESLEARLAADPALQRSLQVMRRALTPLRSDADHLAPPLGLAERCCRAIEEKSKVAQEKQYAEVAGGRVTWRWADLAVAAAVLFVASMLFFPSVMKSRFDQQVAFCNENLHQLGLDMWQYSQNHGGYFPYVPPEGNYAAAGIFGPLLSDAGLLSEPQKLICPSSPQANADLSLVSLDNLKKADKDQLALLQRNMGGSYGYALGYEKDGRYYGHKNQSRTRFALMADSPSMPNGCKRSVNHDGRGQNVLYEDGHVQFQRNCTAVGSQDDIFHNDLGIIGAGQHANDSVVAPSNARPVQMVHLRLFYLVPKSKLPKSMSPAAEKAAPTLYPIDQLQ